MKAVGVSFGFVLLLTLDLSVQNHDSCWAFGFVTTARTRDEQRMPTTTAVLGSSSRPVLDWAKCQTLASVLPRDDALAIVTELLAQNNNHNNSTLARETERRTRHYWDKLDARLRGEQRTLAQVLGPSNTNRLLQSVSKTQYDRTAVTEFLASDAVNRLLARLLYNAIREFLQNMDLIGNVVNTLPIIGPIRQQVVQQFQRNLDATAGPLIQRFLGAYTQVAVQEAIRFVLSKDNQQSFAGANVKLVSNLLNRPVCTLVPSLDTSQQLQEDFVQFLGHASRKNNTDTFLHEAQGVVDALYDLADNKTIHDIIDVDAILDASPTLQHALDRIWDNANAHASNHNNNKNNSSTTMTAILGSTE